MIHDAGRHSVRKKFYFLKTSLTCKATGSSVLDVINMMLSTYPYLVRFTIKKCCLIAIDFFFFYPTLSLQLRGPPFPIFLLAIHCGSRSFHKYEWDCCLDHTTVSLEEILVQDASNHSSARMWWLARPMYSPPWDNGTNMHDRWTHPISSSTRRAVYFYRSSIGRGESLIISCTTRRRRDCYWRSGSTVSERLFLTSFLAIKSLSFISSCILLSSSNFNLRDFWLSFLMFSTIPFHSRNIS